VAPLLKRGGETNLFREIIIEKLLLYPLIKLKILEFDFFGN
jgi:hypothetical protein